MKLKLFLIPALTGVFSWLFWHQEPGLNIVIYTLIVALFVFAANRDAIRNRTASAFLAGALVSAFMVFLHGPGWALFANIVSLFLFVTAVFMRPLNIPLYLSAQSFISLVLVPLNIQKIPRVGRTMGTGSSTSLGKWTRLIIVPVAALILFYFLYLLGSPHFRKANQEVIDVLIEILEKISWEYFFFMIWAVWMAIFFLVTPKVSTGLSNGNRVLQRVRQRFTYNPSRKLHYRMLSGVVLFTLLNLLLAVVNWIDIKTLWISFEVPENFSLMDFVHSGMWVLSFCIILSVFIVAFYFKGNLNFYSKSKSLKILSVIWIVQNLIMTYSVFLRDWYYIRWHGLAYGRVFLLFLLAVITFSLIMILLKVLRRYSSDHVYRMNSWFAYALVVIAALFDWDFIIIKHNIAHPNSGQVDYAMYLRVSPDHFDYVKANKEKINHQIAIHQNNKVRWVVYGSEKEFWDTFKYRAEDALRDEVNKSWQSYIYNRRTNLHELQLCTVK